MLNLSCLRARSKLLASCAAGLANGTIKEYNQFSLYTLTFSSTCPTSLNNESNPFVVMLDIRALTKVAPDGNGPEQLLDLSTCQGSPRVHH